jgi:hypothetical protein
MNRPQTLRGVSPAAQRINQTVSPVIQELQWIKDNSTSVKAVNQAGRAMLSYEIAERYADKAFTFHAKKEEKQLEQQQESTSGKRPYARQRFQEAN